MTVSNTGELKIRIQGHQACSTCRARNPANRDAQRSVSDICHAFSLSFTDL